MQIQTLKPASFDTEGDILPLLAYPLSEDSSYRGSLAVAIVKFLDYAFRLFKIILADILIVDFV